ncbi:MAG: hypothetical protein Q7S56_00245 [Nanoarchaeota archaeon]|nr:hypothetical protein [Nanoarchaeota archaeon]
MASPNENHERKPYVSYLLEADIADKGIAFSIKNAIQKYIQKHRPQLEIETRGFDKSSAHFSMILDLYDNGNYDFNMEVLRDHIQNAPQLPSNVHYKPKITIRPISSQEKTETGSSKSDEAWIQTVDKLRSEKEEKDRTLRDQEKEVQGLTKLLSAKQDSITEQSEKIRKLEERLEATEPFDINTPAYSLAEELFDAYRGEVHQAREDWKILGETKDRQVFLESRGGQEIDSLLKYVSVKTGLKFSSEEEMKKWIQDNSYEKWEDSPVSKAYEDAINGIRRDISLMEKMRREGASEGLIKSLDDITVKRKEELEKKGEDAQNLRNRLEFNQKKCKNLKDAQQTYNIFREISYRAEERSKAQIDFPIVASIHPDVKEVLFYVPLPEEDEMSRNLTKRINTLGEKIIYTNKVLVVTEEPEDILEIGIKINDKTRLEKIIHGEEDNINKEPILNSLGFKTEPLILIQNLRIQGSLNGWDLSNIDFSDLHGTSSE